MLFAGSDDGVYRLPGVLRTDDEEVADAGGVVADADGADGDDDTDPDGAADRVLESGRVMRLRHVEGVGLLAATETGLYHSSDGEAWTDLGVPRRKVYAVGAAPDAGRLYAGTRPAHLYVADLTDQVGSLREGRVTWHELDGFQDLPSRAEWRLPRHENLAQVRDVHADGAGRVVAGVEVGGVHVSEDGGATWTERAAGVNNDVHELHVVAPGEYVAATGFGLFHTADAGRSWTRLDEGFDQRYFRSALAADGTIYAGAALSNSSTWEDDDADPALFRSADGRTLEAVDHPRPAETVTGLTAVDGVVLAATHRGSVLRRDADGWRAAGSVPVSDRLTGRYTPLSWFGE